MAENFRADFKIIVQNTDEMREFYVNKRGLASQSPVFAAIMQENESEGYYIINGCDCSIFHAFLTFVYTGKVILPAITPLLKLYRLAESYEVNDLKLSCLTILRYEASEPDVQIMRSFAAEHQLRELEALCTQLEVTFTERRLRELNLN